MRGSPAAYLWTLVHDGRTCLRKPERRQSSSMRRTMLSEQGNTVYNGEARVPVCVPVAFRHGFSVRLAVCNGHTEANDVGSSQWHRFTTLESSNRRFTERCTWNLDGSFDTEDFNYYSINSAATKESDHGKGIHSNFI